LDHQIALKGSSTPATYGFIAILYPVVVGSRNENQACAKQFGFQAMLMFLRATEIRRLLPQEVEVGRSCEIAPDRTMVGVREKKSVEEL